jgi:hypothetical protein
MLFQARPADCGQLAVRLAPPSRRGAADDVGLGLVEVQRFMPDHVQAQTGQFHEELFERSAQPLFEQILTFFEQE